MCGICGIYNEDFSLEEIRQKIIRMNKTLLHRGPDGDNVFYENKIALGHTRLSVRDLSDLGSQPMFNDNKSIVLTFNGEIYNFEDLKNQLKSLSVKFKSQSDTEVIIRIYENWGLKGLKKLEGMFALALWDKSEERLVLMRDRLGIKPLFYKLNKNSLIFGSEIKAIKASGFLSKEINDQSFSEFLWYGNSFEDKTIYKDVSSLLPGHWLIFQRNNVKLEKYWCLEEWTNRDKFKGSKSECIYILEKKLNDAVKRQYSADVPVSLFLSGGIDSSAIALASKNLTIDKTSYTAFFNNNDKNSDSLKAIKVASLLNLNHKLIKVSTNDLERIVQNLVISHDEPFGDAANIPLYLMSKEFSKYGKVVIQGDGGDELFAGYRQYSILFYSALLSKIPSIINFPLNHKIDNFLSRLYRISEISREKDDGIKLAMLVTLEVNRNSPFRVFKKEKKDFLNKFTDPFLAFKKLNQRLKDKNIFEKMLFSDLLLQLPSQFLTKVDRATMSAGIEARVPLLDEQVAKFAVSIPHEWNINFFQRKIMLRKYLKNKMDKSIINAPKSGFGVPYGEWISSTLSNTVKESILDTDFIEKFSFDKNVLENIILSEDKSRQSKFLIWKLFQLSQWYYLVHNGS